MKIFQFFFFAFVCGFFGSSFASPPWVRQWNKGHHHGSHHDCAHHEHGYESTHSGPPVREEYRSPKSEHGCSCLLFVDDKPVFARADARGWYSCSGWGLYRCTQYCDELFQDENLRYRSRQDACDVIGHEIFTPWYRKNQVCGVYGPYEDVPLNIDLCCRRGRPSQECTDDAQT